MSFRLSKWYLDCVTDAGDAAVLYWALLQWGPLRLRYGAAILAPTSGSPSERYTLRPDAEPSRDEAGALHWRCRRLDAVGTWEKSEARVARTLLQGSEGLVHWSCVCPRAQATVRVGDHVLRGLGYVEHLAMTIPPWKLPFDELRWGRFLSPTSSLAWIQWRGAYARTWMFTAGKVYERVEVTATGVSAPEGGLQLRFSEGRVLRAGPIAATALRPLWAAASLVPRWRNATETKWVTPGSVSAPDGQSGGWVIHEVVRWQ